MAGFECFCSVKSPVNILGCVPGLIFTKINLRNEFFAIAPAVRFGNASEFISLFGYL